MGPESRNTKSEDLSSLLFFFFFYIFITEASESSWSAKQEMVTGTWASPRGSLQHEGHQGFYSTDTTGFCCPGIQARARTGITGPWDWWSQGSVVTGTGGHGGQWSGRLVSQRLLATGINGQKGWGLQGSMVTGINGHRDQWSQGSVVTGSLVTGIGSQVGQCSQGSVVTVISGGRGQRDLGIQGSVVTQVGGPRD